MGTEAIFRRQVLRAFILPPLLFCVLSAVFLGVAVSLLVMLDRVGQGGRLLTCGNATGKSLSDREIALRSYRVDPSSALLREYQEADQAVKRQFEEMGRLTHGNQNQDRQISQIREQSELWGREAEEELGRPGRPAKEGRDPESGRRADQIRSSLVDFLAGQHAGFDRQREMTQMVSLGVLAGLSGSILPLAGLVVYSSRKQMVALLGTIGSAVENLQAKLDRQELENLGLLSESMKYYAILKLDTEGRIVTWNTDCERILGYRADDILGRRPSCFSSDSATAMDVLYHDLEWATLEGRVEDDRKLIRKDGFHFQAHVTLAAVRDASGSLTGFTNVVHEIEV